VNFANHDSVTPDRMREVISALRSGDVPEPSRGGPRVSSFKSASRVLAGLEEAPA
jgi:hypothetical protein